MTQIGRPEAHNWPSISENKISVLLGKEMEASSLFIDKWTTFRGLSTSFSSELLLDFDDTCQPLQWITYGYFT